jgi:tRNA(Ile2)-agmatinylcytidine synthase
VTVIGIDDTDSRTGGMCTTYVAHRIARELRRRGATVDRVLLVRLNPGVEFKTRGNAALAVHADVDPLVAIEVATSVVGDLAMHDDEQTNSGVVVAHHDPGDVPDAVADFARRAVTDILDPGEALGLADAHDFETRTWGTGRGVVGALAAIGAWLAFEDWTHEHIAYRESDRWGTDRDVDADTAFEAAEDAYPSVWDTVDRGEGEVVCVPRTPCPVLYGIRGDDPAACRRVADAIESEPIATERTFLTNQGTDVHLTDLADPDPGDLAENRSYRLDGTVVGDPETRRGGHVFVPFALGEAAAGGEPALDLAAFEPTKRFRDHVRALRPGDALTVCGEVADGALNLEKFRVDALVTTDAVTPTCPDCDRRMESAGADQGYRCRDCGTSAPGKVDVPLERDLERGWHEVPPRARRHVAKPLVRGGFAGPTHPDR